MQYINIFHANLNYAYLTPDRYEFVIRTAYEMIIDTMGEVFPDTPYVFEASGYTLEEMAPLFLAVAHGCHAGRHQEALDKVYGEL